VQVVYRRGEFAQWPEATDRVTLALALYAIGIWAYALNQLVVRTFYALHDARTPMRVAAVNVVLNLALNLWLVQTSLKEAGLALATSLCAFVQLVVLLRHLDRRIGHLDWSEIRRGTGRILVATAVMGGAVYAVDLLAATSFTPLIRLGVLIGVGAPVYVGASWFLRCPELRDMFRR
jgi:putative peptidoglycan lipid II flippase